jgi:hypothetical protein
MLKDKFQPEVPAKFWEGLTSDNMATNIMKRQHINRRRFSLPSLHYLPGSNCFSADSPLAANLQNLLCCRPGFRSFPLVSRERVQAGGRGPDAGCWLGLAQQVAGYREPGLSSRTDKGQQPLRVPRPAAPPSPEEYHTAANDRTMDVPDAVSQSVEQGRNRDPPAPR